ncbi:tetratricopeptide repeat protein [Candidatus Viadribacter manganicus]|nr:tetratricopeptide repeat protein [Candidatus Viadribacter manganicus]
MKRLLIGSIVALGFVAVAAPAMADIQWRVFELRRQQCFNSANAFTPEQSIRGCSDVISMRSVSGDGRAQAYKLRGDRYRELRDYDLALADYSTVIRMRGDHPGAYYRRSEVYLAMGQYDLAMADAEHVIAIASDTPGGYRVRCEIRVAQNIELDLARQDCNHALEINSIDTAALSARGVLNLRANQNQEAWSDFDAAIFNGRQNAQTLYGRGIAGQRLGRVREARADMEAAERLQAEIVATFARYGVTAP